MREGDLFHRAGEQMVFRYQVFANPMLVLRSKLLSTLLPTPTSGVRCVISSCHKSGSQANFLPENIFLTGNLNALQNWSPGNALALSSAKYPTWSGKRRLPISEKSISFLFQLQFRFQQTRTFSTNTFASTTVVLPGRQIQTMSTPLPLLVPTLLTTPGGRKQPSFVLYLCIGPRPEINLRTA